MLKDKTSSAIVGVSDLDRARAFYVDTLGLELAASDEAMLSFTTGDSALTVYVSDGFRPGTANAVAWGASGEVEAIARDLAAKGVVLQDYPEMGLEITDGVHRDGDFLGLWFKDPDGNTLHVNNL